MRICQVEGEKFCEAITPEGRYIQSDKAKTERAIIWVWREADSSAPPKDDARKIKDANNRNFRFYRPEHPVTGRACRHPNGGWRLRYAPDPDDSASDSFLARKEDHRIVWGSDKKKIPQLKRFLHEVGGNGSEEEGGLAVPKSVFHDYTDGAKQIESLFREKGVFAGLLGQIAPHLPRVRPPYLAVETTHGTLVVFRDIDDAEDDTTNLNAILARYVDEQGVSTLQVNHDADLRRLAIDTILITAGDFMHGAQW